MSQMDASVEYLFTVRDPACRLAVTTTPRFQRGWEPRPDVKNWIERCGTGRWWYCPYTNAFFFEVENDAIHFKLRWL